MNYIKKIYNEIKSKPNANETIDHIIDIMDDILMELKEGHPDKYAKVKNKLYIASSGYHFNEDMLEEALKSMVNDDGTKGAKWSLSDTNSAASNNGINMRMFNQYDWNYVMNMMYSDFCEVLGDNTISYIKLAHKFLNDKDAPDGKALRYYLCMRDK